MQAGSAGNIAAHSKMDQIPKQSVPYALVRDIDKLLKLHSEFANQLRSEKAADKNKESEDKTDASGEDFNIVFNQTDSIKK